MEIELASLLSAAWIAAILPILVVSIHCGRFSSFHRVVMTFASRGKTMQSSSRKFTVPQRFFLHFYVVAVAWTTVLLLMTWFYAYWMVPLSSESFHYSTVASHLTGGSHILSMHKPRPTPEKHKYRPFSSDAHFWLLNWALRHYHYVAIVHQRIHEASHRAWMVPMDWCGHFYLGLGSSEPLSFNSCGKSHLCSRRDS
ncbi:hypothetical protein NE237_023908 [Protea cynaroides]|uniref:Polyprenol reductase n=1 Tax=Protea cynaroides TaxID=273540 RepID=A0A9Q0HHU8_9MAGN|nr:hypothetical protein NE237_023908 [Protea cynaroides]